MTFICKCKGCFEDVLILSTEDEVKLEKLRRARGYFHWKCPECGHVNKILITKE